VAPIGDKALALKAASSTDQVCGFGSLVTEHRSVVIFSTEDDADEIHRHLERLDTKSGKKKKSHIKILYLLFLYQMQNDHSL
jgi:hypothetical protein